MDMGINLDDFQGRIAGTLDWHGLRARLSTGYRSHAVLSAKRTGDSGLACGSFDPDAARLLARYHERLADINLTLSVDGNCRNRKDGAVADAQMAGDRG